MKVYMVDVTESYEDRSVYDGIFKTFDLARDYVENKYKVINEEKNVTETIVARFFAYDSSLKDENIITDQDGMKYIEYYCETEDDVFRCYISDAFLVTIDIIEVDVIS